MNQVTHNTDHLDDQTISASIDGELSPSENQRVRHHLTACHDCALRVVTASQFKSATARAGRRFTPPPQLLARVTAQLDLSQAATKTSQRGYPVRTLAWSAIAATLLLAVSLLGWRQFQRDNTLSAELLDQHLTTLSNSAAPQVVSSDKHTVKPWFQGRLPFSFNLPDTASLPPDTVLNGADLTYFHGQPAALLLFTIGKHQVSVMLMQKASVPTFAKSSESRAGFTIRTATTSDLFIAAVSNVNPNDLDRLVEILVQAQGTP